MPIRPISYKFIILTVLIAFFIPALSQQIIEKPFDLYIGEDAVNNYSINKIITQNCLNKKIPNGVVNKGTTTFPLYVKVIVHKTHPSDKIYLVVSNPILDQVTYYQSAIDSQLIKETTPIESRVIKDQNYIFALQKDTVYIKVETKEQMLFNLFVATKNEIYESNSTRDNIVFFYIGIMLVMFLYNLFLFINTKDNNYLLYILYILFVALTQLTFHGFIIRYLPVSFNYIKVNAIYIFGALSGLTTLLFMANFIDTKRNLGKLNWFIRFFIAIDVLAILLVIGNQHQMSYSLININAGVGSLVVLILAAMVAHKKNRSARFFLIAWSLFLTSVIVFVLKDYGVVPYNALTSYILLFGSAIEVTLISLALADKINILKKEKEFAQAAALNSAQENERIMKEQNIILEQKVVKRTTALTETNNNLSIALNNLKQAQTQLVESEKMASLGQLTAGIAHEINNPINFVTSNIKPLERDIKELYKLQEETEKQLIGNQLAIDYVNKYKIDIDFDYLKTEISFLLKGIQEGSSRTAEIVKGLRIFSRVDEDDIKLASINEGLDSTIIIANNQLNNKISIDKDYADLPYIECFPGKLNQVFLNLISNAIYAIKLKFEENDGGQIHIKTERTESTVIITIKDNGAGMTEKTKNKLFEPFFTTKPVGEGTGLGLSITYNTIKKHNGCVSVESKLGEGTVFIITIPIKYHNE
jgi:signal transduction histidine kinase